MDIAKISSLVALLCGYNVLIFAQTRDCSGTCTLQFRCNPFGRNLIWAVSEGVCRVFQNGCFFASHNCQRENQCMRSLNSTSPEKCKEFCPSHCPSRGPQVCATIYDEDTGGVIRDRQMTFSDACYLNQYACRNAKAYIGEPSIGACS